MDSSRYEEIMKSSPYLPFNMGGRLTEAMVAKAREELGETEEVREKTIPELRKLVQAEEGFFCPTDDAYLLIYLRARKFDVKKAFSLLKSTFRLKTSNSDIAGSFDLEALKRAFSLKTGFFLPYRDQDGCVIAVIRMRTWDVEVASPSDAVAALVMGCVWALEEPATQVCGIRLLFDVEGANLKQIRSLFPRHAILIARAFTSSVPIRVKGFHLYNESPIFGHMISIVKLFLSEKLKNRFLLHGENQEDLHKYIPKAILPAKDFGGDNPNDVADWNNAEVVKYFETYRQFTTYGYKN